MKRSTQTALDLIRLAALFRKCSEEIVQIKQRDKLQAAACELEAAAHAMIKEERAKVDGATEKDLYAPVRLTI
jgi:hypothetical protein